MTTITGLLKKISDTDGSGAAVCANNKIYTWRELDSMSDSYAERLLKKGIRPGSHIGILDHNSLFWILSFLAIRKAGCTAILFNGRNTLHELRSIMKLSSTEYICVGKAVERSLKDDVSAFIEASPDVFLKEKTEKDVTLIKQSAPLKQKTDQSTDHFSTRLLNKNCQQEENCNLKDPDIACFIFTSGSTSKPKCVMLSDESLIANAEAMANVMHYTKEDRICVSTPFFHVFSLVCNLLAAMTKGSQIILPDSIKSASLLDTIERYKCTVFNGVPTSFLAMTANAGFSKEKVKTIRIGTLGGAKVNLSQMKELRAAFPNAELMINYGSTEAGFACNTDEGDSLEIVSTTVGKEMEHMHVAIEDLSTGMILPCNQSGEVLVRGIGIMSGYYGLPEEEQAIDRNGYLHTGDIGFIDPEGRLHITDRKKNIIIRGGENISPSEVENVIAQYEPVRDVVVLGIPNDVLGEEPVAFLTIKKGAVFKEKELTELLSANLAKFKIPKKILLLDSFPLTANGKKDTLALKQMTL